MFEAQPDIPIACSTCGAPLGFSYDDQPDWPSGPICGSCYQANQEDDELLELYGDDG